MPSALKEKWRPFNCFFSRVGLRTYQRPCICQGIQCGFFPSGCYWCSDIWNIFFWIIVRTTMQSIPGRGRSVSLYTACIPPVRFPTYLSKGSFTGEKTAGAWTLSSRCNEVWDARSYIGNPHPFHDVVFNAAQWRIFDFVILLICYCEGFFFWFKHNVLHIAYFITLRAWKYSHESISSNGRKVPSNFTDLYVFETRCGQWFLGKRSVRISIRYRFMWTSLWRKEIILVGVFKFVKEHEYVCVYVCMCVCIYVCMYVCMYVCVCVWRYNSYLTENCVSLRPFGECCIGKAVAVCCYTNKEYINTLCGRIAEI